MWLLEFVLTVLLWSLPMPTPVNANISGALDLTTLVNTAPDYETVYTQDVLDIANTPDWDSGTTYIIGDLVQIGSPGTVYRCILGHTNQSPPNVTYWTVATDLQRAAWFKYTAQEEDVVVGVMVYATSGGHVGYRPKVTVYLGPTSAPTRWLPSGDSNEMIAGHDQAMQVPVTPSVTYYFQVLPDASSTGVFPDLNIRMTRGPRETVPVDALFITDDTVGYPGAYLDPVDGHVLRFVPFTAGEHGAVLPDGTIAHTNDGTTDPLAVIVYDRNHNILGSVALTNSASVLSMKADGVDAFYISQHLTAAADTVVRKISNTGTLLDSWTITGTFDSIAVDPVSEILYYGNSSTSDGPVKRYDLANSVGLSDLSAGIAGFLTWFDMFVLEDHTILVVFSTNTNSDFFARQFSTAGATIRDFAFTPPAARTDGPRSAYNLDDTFVMWASGVVSGDRVSHYEMYRISDGTQLASFDRFVFQQGVGPAGSGNDPDIQRFGTSKSCPILFRATTIAALPEAGSLIDHSAPCPCPCECADDGTGPQGATGDPLPPIDATWTPECTGGGTPDIAAEVTDDEDWTDTTPPKSPDAWLTLHVDPEVEGSPADASVVRWGVQPLSDTGRFVEGRLKEVGSIERGSSDKDGHYPPARVRVVANDDDGAVRARLGNDATKHLLNLEAKIELESYAGRKAGLDPLPLIQGRIVDVQPALDRQAVVELQDIVGSQFGFLDPDKKIGLVIGDEHPDAPDGTRGKKIYNIIYGEHSDIGQLNAAGEPADIGMIPCVDCGDTDFATGSPSGLMVSAPQNLVATKVGSATGSHTYYYAIVGVTNFGHTQMSNIESVSGLPASLDKDDYVHLEWDAPAIGAEYIIAYWVLGRTAAIPNKRLDTMNNDGTFVNPETTYNDGRDGSRTDFDTEKSVNFQNIETAPASNDSWTWFAVAIGEVDVIAIYGSDLAEGVAPKRTRLTIGAGDIQTPEVRVVGGITQTGFYARGPRVQHHRDGQVTFAANVCGYKGVNGLLINQAFLILLSFLNEFVEKNDGEGYRTGSFGPIETFSDGTPKFWTSKFEAAQDLTIAWLGSPAGLGYIGSLAVCEPTPLSDILRDFFVTFGGHFTSDHHGRMYPYLVDMDEDGVGAQLFKERREISRLIDHEIAWKELENRLVYDYHYNYDTRSYRNIGNTMEDAASILAHGGDRVGVLQTDVKACKFGNDPATMTDRWTRHLGLYSEAPRYVTWATNLEQVQLPNGSPVRFTHRKEGLGAVGELASVGILQHTETRIMPYELQHRVRITSTVIAVEEEEPVPGDALIADGSSDSLTAEDGDVLISD